MPAVSLPSDFTMPITPAFAAEQAEALGLPSFPATLATATIRPKPRARIPGSTARQER